MSRAIFKLVFICFVAIQCGDDVKQKSSSHVAGIGACASGHLTKQCGNRGACRLACAVGGGAVSAAARGSAVARVGAAGGAQICSELCSDLPECSEVFVCDRFERGGP